MYRSVPSDVKEGSFRNGDWVTPSYGYAVDNANVHGWGDNYRIIEQKVSVDEIWWDGNDIAEWDMATNRTTFKTRITLIRTQKITVNPWMLLPMITMVTLFRCQSDSMMH